MFNVQRTPTGNYGFETISDPLIDVPEGTAVKYEIVPLPSEIGVPLGLKLLPLIGAPLFRAWGAFTIPADVKAKYAKGDLDAAALGSLSDFDPAVGIDALREAAGAILAEGGADLARTLLGGTLRQCAGAVQSVTQPLDFSQAYRENYGELMEILAVVCWLNFRGIVVRMGKRKSPLASLAKAWLPT